MAPLPAARFIPEFGVEPPKTSLTPAGTSIALNMPHFEAPQPKTSIFETEEAYERGFAAGKAEAYNELEKKLEEQRTYYDQQLTLERFTWAKRESDKLAEGISEGLKEIETKLAGVVARILRPFLMESAHEQAISELASALEALLGTTEGITLEISGPEDLSQLLREKLGARDVAVQFRPSESTDVRVVAGQTVLETCLGTWMKKVEECLE